MSAAAIHPLDALPARVAADTNSATGSAKASKVEWRLKRNCSVTPVQALGFFASLAIVSLLIGLAFWSQGVAFVLVFTVAEVVALGTALLVFARHAADGECVSLEGDRLVVERSHGCVLQRDEWHAGYVRVGCVSEGGAPALIEISGQGRRVLVGRHLRSELREPLAREMRRVLREWAR